RDLLLALLLAAGAGAGGDGRAPLTDHFDGKRLHNLEPMPLNFGDRVRWEMAKNRPPWGPFRPGIPAPCPAGRVGDDRIRVTWVNHATVLIQMDGVNVLTDPTWARRAVPTVGPIRRRPPGIDFESLPPIDVVLVSHDHHDHMDLPTLRRLAAEHGPAFYAPLGNGAFLAKNGVGGVRDLDWWQSVRIAPGLVLTAVPARHASGRGPFPDYRRLWSGFVLTGAAGSVYFAGDTGEGSHFAAIGARFPDLRVALLPIGGFEPPWYMAYRHLGPQTALRELAELGSAVMIPIHYGTFPQGNDSEAGPLDRLCREITEAPDPKPNVVILQHGEAFEAAGAGTIPANANPRRMPKA
ncbi:MAG TPA: MBL fold metallo-hydrolase, partial [Thermoanaerobaculia bacterium]|nr:MBL fold metallo-hydrolase [Thermoanaerobaculia bacterium]